MFRPSKRRYAAWRHKLSGGLVFLTVLLLVAILVIYRSQIRHGLLSSGNYEYSLSSQGLVVDISKLISVAPQNRAVQQARSIKVSVPMSEVPLGCEFIYGLVVYDFDSRDVSASPFWPVAYSQARHLVKFKYDMVNSRCEAKVLTLLENDPVKNITVQIIDVMLNDQSLVEQPRAKGIRVSLGKDFRNLSPSASETLIEPKFPFVSYERTIRNKSFSTANATGISLMIHPYDSLRDFIIKEINSRVAKCKTSGVCDSIKVAVARFSDPEILDSLEMARLAGLDVQIIVNFSGQQDLSERDIDLAQLKLPASSLLWVRALPYGPSANAHLPMHTKFIIFGNDLVVSSNPNYALGLRYKSREFSVVYRNADIVSIFKEIFSIVKTSLFYPVKINSSDPVIILLNADRPRGYSAMSRKPYLSVHTETGLSTSAYGVLYSLLTQSATKLRLAMSPLTDSCAIHERRLCLFDLLNNKARSGNLELYLNAWFYGGNVVATTLTGLNPYSMENLRDKLANSNPLTKLKAFFQKNTSNFHLRSQIDIPTSVHHERAAVLGDKIAILGSANWAQPSTVNTIEVLRVPDVITQLTEEFDTFEDPWFVTRASNSGKVPLRYGNCEFVFEVELGNENSVADKAHSITRSEMLNELARKYAVAPEADIRLVTPLTERQISAKKIKPSPAFDIASGTGISKTVLLAEASVPASYLCIEDSATGNTYVIRSASR